MKKGTKMKNTDIQKIRQLLREIKIVASQTQGDIFYYIKAEQALALLPCETCGGTKLVPTAQSAGFGKQNAIMQECPDCQIT